MFLRHPIVMTRRMLIPPCSECRHFLSANDTPWSEDVCKCPSVIRFFSKREACDVNKPKTAAARGRICCRFERKRRSNE